MPDAGVKNKEKMKLSIDAVNRITLRLDWKRDECIRNRIKGGQNVMPQGLQCIPRRMSRKCQCCITTLAFEYNYDNST